MKKLLALAIIVLTVICFVACDGNPTASGKHNEIVNGAIQELKDFWTLEYQRELLANSDGHFEIQGTRVVTVKDNDIEGYSDVAYVVEFILYSDYYSTAPYYICRGINNCVLVYKDGTMEVAGRSPIEGYFVTYGTLSDIVESVNDCKDMYNCTEKLK